MPKTSSGTWISMSSLTLTWQPRRQWSAISLREKWGSSVGRMVPPPAGTWQRHCTQVPPPPQADGRNTPALPSVVSRVLPPSTSRVRSPLMTSLRVPLGDRRDFANRSKLTNSRMTARKNAMVRRIVVVMIACSDFNAHEGHEGHAHEAGQNEGNAEALERVGDVGVADLLADGGDGHDGQ